MKAATVSACQYLPEESVLVKLQCSKPPHLHADIRGGRDTSADRTDAKPANAAGNERMPHRAPTHPSPELGAPYGCHRRSLALMRPWRHHVAGGAYSVLAQRQTVCRISHTAVAGKKSTNYPKVSLLCPPPSFKMPAGVSRCRICQYEKAAKGKPHTVRTFPLPQHIPTPPRTAYALLFLTVCSDE